MLDDRKPTHYCDTCKRSVPCAPGVPALRDASPATIGVAHVTQGPEHRSALCWPRHTYRLDEQVANLDLLALEDDIFRFRIAGDGGAIGAPLLGDWTVDFSTEPPSYAPGAARGAPCTIDVSDRDLAAMLEDPALGMKLYFQGRLRVSGDTLLALRLPGVLEQLLRVPEIVQLASGVPAIASETPGPT